MINIYTEIEKFESFKVCAIYAQGHADYAPQGQDIVCSAVSVLLQTFQRYCEDKDMDVTVIAAEPGDYRIVVAGNMEEAYDMLMTGLWMIRESYPNNLNISGKK